MGLFIVYMSLRMYILPLLHGSFQQNKLEANLLKSGMPRCDRSDQTAWPYIEIERGKQTVKLYGFTIHLFT